LVDETGLLHYAVFRHPSFVPIICRATAEKEKDRVCGLFKKGILERMAEIPRFAAGRKSRNITLSPNGGPFARPDPPVSFPVVKLSKTFDAGQKKHGMLLSDQWQFG